MITYKSLNAPFGIFWLISVQLCYEQYNKWLHLILCQDTITLNNRFSVDRIYILAINNQNEVRLYTYGTQYKHKTSWLVIVIIQANSFHNWIDNEKRGTKDTKGTVKLINLKQTDNAMAKNEKDKQTTAHTTQHRKLKNKQH